MASITTINSRKTAKHDLISIRNLRTPGACYSRDIYSSGGADVTEHMGSIDELDLSAPFRVSKLSPTADGTVADPTFILDPRFGGCLFFIDISTYHVVVKLDDISKFAVGLKVKFILSSESDGEATKNFGIITDDTDTDIRGYINGAGAIKISANTSSVYWDTSDGAASAGDWCELTTDGVTWYIKGDAANANAVDIASGHDVTT